MCLVIWPGVRHGAGVTIHHTGVRGAHSTGISITVITIIGTIIILATTDAGAIIAIPHGVPIITGQVTEPDLCMYKPDTSVAITGKRIQGRNWLRKVQNSLEKIIQKPPPQRINYLLLINREGLCIRSPLRSQ